MISLIRSGSDPNLINRKGVTPISVAAHRGNVKIIQTLISVNANVNSLNTSGSTALIQVCLLFIYCLLLFHCNYYC